MLRIVLQDIIINMVCIASLYTIFRIAHQGTYILHVFINTDWMFYYMHNSNNTKCAALTFGVGSIKLRFHTIVFTQYMHAKMFSTQMLLYTFQSNCAKDLRFSPFHSIGHQPYRTRWWCLKCVIVYLARDIQAFVMYCVNGASRSSLLYDI